MADTVNETDLGACAWRVTHAYPDEMNPALGGIARIAEGELSGPDWIPASVPGDVQSDALAAGLIPDINFGLNSRQAEWTSQRDWTYCTRFTAPRPAGARDRHVLRFDGVDYACNVFLNGKWLGFHEGAWSPFEFDVTDAVRYGSDNSLIVTVKRAPDEEGQFGRTSRVSTLKARFAYGWDWSTRLVPLGIWRGVRLVRRGAVHITDLAVRQDVDLERGRARLSIALDVAPLPAGAARGRAAPVSARFVLSLDGAEAAECTARGDATGGATLHAVMDVPNPQLWHPNGFGSHPVYGLSCTLSDAAGNALDDRTVPVGLRKIEWVANDRAPRDAAPYCVKVNGRRVFLAGWNWTPSRQLYAAATEEVYSRRLALARDAHCTLLRVWGGGILERPVFYETCDAMGIMVFQELFQSSGNLDNHPSQDPAFVALLKDQASACVRRLRDHPSVAIWCGGNELSVRGDVTDEHGAVLRPGLAGWEGYATDSGPLPWRPLAEDYPTLAALRDTVRGLDPDRAWVPASANGPLEMAALEDRGRMHDVHGPWMHMGPARHYEFFDGVDMLFHSEFGCDGACSVESLREFLPEGSLWPPDGTNPMAWHHGRMWTRTSLKRTEELFGPLPDIETYVRASQFSQAEGLAYAMEAHRRRAWRTGGALVWHFAEPWPNVCDTCAVDWREHPKPSYFALARANRPVHVSASYASTLWLGKGEFRAEAWGHNAANVAFRGTALAEVRSMDGRVHAAREEAAVIPAESPARILAITSPITGLAGGVFLLRCVLRNEAGVEVSQHWSVHSAAEGAPFAGLRSLPAGSIDASAGLGWLTVRNTGSSCVVGLWFESPRIAHGRLEDNWLCLVPGEERRLAVKEAGARLVMSAWNMAPREVALA